MLVLRVWKHGKFWTMSCRAGQHLSVVTIPESLMWLWNHLVCCWYMSTLFWNSALVKHEWCVHHAAGGKSAQTTRPMTLRWHTFSWSKLFGITLRHYLTNLDQSPCWNTQPSALAWSACWAALVGNTTQPTIALVYSTQSSCTMTAAFPGCLAWPYVDATNATLDMERHVLTKLPAGWSTDPTGVHPIWVIPFVFITWSDARIHT